MTDTSHRIHIAANDPAFPAKREAAVALIIDAIDAVATGYTRKGTTWSRTTAQGRTIISLQRNQYGWHADINLRFILPGGEPATTGHWAGLGEVHLGQFFDTGSGDGQLAYLDVTDGDALDHAMHILRIRALPWLDQHHQPAAE